MESLQRKKTSSYHDSPKLVRLNDIEEQLLWKINAKKDNALATNQYLLVEQLESGYFFLNAAVMQSEWQLKGLWG